MAKRLYDYIRSMGMESFDGISHIGYTGVKAIVKNSGRTVGTDLAPHNLRRHVATYDSRASAALEIVSKVVLRHANLATTP